MQDHVFSRVTAPSQPRCTVYSTVLDDGHEHTCHVCSDVGELIICDRPGCIYSFHLKCVGLDDVPDGDWICNYCSANPIDPNDGHHVYCVECGQPGNLIMCDVRDCPRSYHFSCVGLSDDLLPGELSRVSHFQSSLTAAPPPPIFQKIGFAHAIHQSTLRASSSAFCRGSLSFATLQSAAPVFKTNCKRLFNVWVSRGRAKWSKISSTTRILPIVPHKLFSESSSRAKPTPRAPPLQCPRRRRRPHQCTRLSMFVSLLRCIWT